MDSDEMAALLGATGERADGLAHDRARLLATLAHAKGRYERMLTTRRRYDALHGRDSAEDAWNAHERAVAELGAALAGLEGKDGMA